MGNHRQGGTGKVSWALGLLKSMGFLPLASVGLTWWEETLWRKLQTLHGYRSTAFKCINSASKFRVLHFCFINNSALVPDRLHRICPQKKTHTPFCLMHSIAGSGVLKWPHLTHSCSELGVFSTFILILGTWTSATLYTLYVMGANVAQLKPLKWELILA